mmetsp:Transcript_18531/g.44125  ORF Transcript_18531/g.44125 Transcript_18531/m.44125 type:complete len:208 (+) Transcript_18531:3093-3716(+)
MLMFCISWSGAVTAAAGCCCPPAPAPCIAPPAEAAEASGWGGTAIGIAAPCWAPIAAADWVSAVCWAAIRAATSMRRLSWIEGSGLMVSRPEFATRDDQSGLPSLTVERFLRALLGRRSLRSRLRLLHSTSTSNLILSLRSSIGWSSARRERTSMVQGLGGQKMRELLHVSRIFATNGTTAIKRPFSYASMISALRSRSRCKMGLFF